MQTLGLAMHAVILTIALSVLGAGPSLSPDMDSDWSERAINQGVSSVDVTLRYSLSDDCYVRNLELLENTHPEIIYPNQIANIASRILGPFESSARQLEPVISDSDIRIEYVKTIQRSIVWRTPEGHSWIVCYLNSSGELERAIHSDGHRPPAEVAPDTPVNKSLSLLGTNEVTITFSIE